MIYAPRSYNQTETAMFANALAMYRLFVKTEPKGGTYVKVNCVSVVSIVCPKEKAAFNNISLSRNTVTRRVQVLGDDLKTTLRERVSIFKFYSLAMDESTDVKNTAQLAIFIRGIDCNFQITKEMAALVPMKGTTTGKDLMEAVVTCMKDLGLSFTNMNGLTSDGAPSMMLTEMEAEYGDLLYYCEVRWLSRGAMLERFYSFRKEIALFLQDKGKSTAKINDPMGTSINDQPSMETSEMRVDNAELRRRVPSID
ncbi:protein FAM200A-like [Uranotaenia lowii]|uniref:protein FAM200A-like n=1 Tax=Uranotaenia lowii TaxID=190385 RepID=UPI0024788A59|nr:protein FAM200A-like [Uranotaenia lowii]